MHRIDKHTAPQLVLPLFKLLALAAIGAAALYPVAGPALQRLAGLL